MSIKIKEWISRMPEYIPGKTIEEIKKEYNLEKVYKLASNENLYGPNPKVLEEICKNLDDIKYYPDSECREIRQKLAEKYNVDRDTIIMGNGTDQIIEMICDSFIEPGEDVVIADPTFLIYEKSAMKCSGTVIKVPLKKLRQDAEMLVGAINKETKILFLTNPHNPTGTNINQKEFDYIVENIKENVLLVVDEAYCEYVPEQERINTIEYLSKYNNLIILRTFSKIYGLAGLRIGYGISDSLIISALNKVRLPFNVNSIAQKAAAAALDNESCINEIRENIDKERNRFYDILNKNGIDFIKSYTNFILINSGENSDVVVEELLKNGFIVRPGKNLGVPGYIRVTIALPEINEKFLSVFIKIFNNLYKKEKV
jgi:histidinol-phosphate aminotransferase